MSRKSRDDKKPAMAALGFTELSTTDSAATRRFLERAFQWQFQELQMPGGQYLAYRAPEGAQLGIRQTQGSEAPSSLNYVRVRDLAQAESKIRELGGKIMLPRTDIPGMGSFFWFRIPSGPIMACWQDEAKK